MLEMNDLTGGRYGVDDCSWYVFCLLNPIGHQTAGFDFHVVSELPGRISVVFRHSFLSSCLATARYTCNKPFIRPVGNLALPALSLMTVRVDRVYRQSRMLRGLC